MRNIKLILEYLGTNYYGFQKQPNPPTIQGELERVLKILLRDEVRTVYAGRTDAGVHATSQVVNFKTESPLEIRRLRRSANALLSPDIVITKAEEVDLSFDARRAAISREYQYHILNRAYPSAFHQKTAYFIARPLNLPAMAEAARAFQGDHDFSAFTPPASNKKRTHLTVSEIDCIQRDDLIVIRIRARSFLHHMVRIIAGTLIEVGLGKLTPQEVSEILKSGDRTKAGPAAPPQGLILTNVTYPGR